MPSKEGIVGWLKSIRSISRVAFVLQLSVKVLTSLLQLFWIRLLVGAMGHDLNGVYIAFRNLVTLGNLGDLGMGGAVSIQVGQNLDEEKQRELARFLSGARAVFITLAVIMAAGFFVASPLIQQKLFGEPVKGTGSVNALFLVGSLGILGVMLASYVNNVNYGCGNVVWPIVPSFLTLQLALCGHWLLARSHQPLWIQYLPYVCSILANLALQKFYIRLSNPRLSSWFPIRYDRAVFISLIEKSFWIYLCSLGSNIFSASDVLVIKAGFSSDTVPLYDNNYKLCSLILTVIFTASLVSLPKLTQWMASKDEHMQGRVRFEANRLNQFQTLLGCAAALGYLAGNNLFMSIWWRNSVDPIDPAPLAWQAAFACNLAVTAGADAGLQLTLRSGNRGLRIGGIAVGLTGLLNLGLSLVAMKFNSILGIAVATVVAQSILSLVATAFICRRLGTSFLKWAMRTWLLPLGVMLVAVFLRLNLPLNSAVNGTVLISIYLLLVLFVAWMLGIRKDTIASEMNLIGKLTQKIRGRKD